MKYVDFTFNKSDYNSCEEITDATAVVNAIKTIILSRPGNFPLTPNLGVDIAKYQFDLLDDQTLSAISAEINRQIALYVPSVDNVSVTVDKVEDIINGKVVTALGIKISVADAGSQADGLFLIKQDHDDISIYDEIHN